MIGSMKENPVITEADKKKYLVFEELK